MPSGRGNNGPFRVPKIKMTGNFFVKLQYLDKIFWFYCSYLDFAPIMKHHKVISAQLLHQHHRLYWSKGSGSAVRTGRIYPASWTSRVYVGAQVTALLCPLGSLSRLRLGPGLVAEAGFQALTQLRDLKHLTVTPIYDRHTGRSVSEAALESLSVLTNLVVCRIFSTRIVLPWDKRWEVHIGAHAHLWSAFEKARAHWSCQRRARGWSQTRAYLEFAREHALPPELLVDRDGR
jgi:hypothetical protein